MEITKGNSAAPKIVTTTAVYQTHADTAAMRHWSVVLNVAEAHDGTQGAVPPRFRESLRTSEVIHRRTSQFHAKAQSTQRSHSKEGASALRFFAPLSAGRGMNCFYFFTPSSAFRPVPPFVFFSPHKGPALHALLESSVLARYHSTRCYRAAL